MVVLHRVKLPTEFRATLKTRSAIVRRPCRTTVLETEFLQTVKMAECVGGIVRATGRRQLEKIISSLFTNSVVRIARTAILTENIDLL